MTESEGQGEGVPERLGLVLTEMLTVTVDEWEELRQSDAEGVEEEEVDAEKVRDPVEDTVLVAEPQEDEVLE